MSATAFGERLLGEVHTERLDEVRGHSCGWQQLTTRTLFLLGSGS
jgi:hypothetical protein